MILNRNDCKPRDLVSSCARKASKSLAAVVCSLLSECHPLCYPQESPQVESPWSESMNQLMRKLDQLYQDIEEALSASSSPADTPCMTRKKPVRKSSTHFLICMCDKEHLQCAYIQQYPFGYMVYLYFRSLWVKSLIWNAARSMLYGVSTVTVDSVHIPLKPALHTWSCSLSVLKSLMFALGEKIHDNASYRQQVVKNSWSKKKICTSGEDLNIFSGTK